MTGERLVYSTDDALKHHNIEYFDESIANEARQDRRDTVNFLHKIKRRKHYMTAPNVTSRTELRQQLFLNIKKTVEFLWGQPRKGKDIYQHVFEQDTKTNKKTFDNMMQTIKHASNGDVLYDGGLWILNYGSSRNQAETVAMLFANRNKRWIKKNKPAPSASRYGKPDPSVELEDDKKLTKGVQLLSNMTLVILKQSINSLMIMNDTIDNLAKLFDPRLDRIINMISKERDELIANRETFSVANEIIKMVKA